MKLQRSLASSLFWKPNCLASSVRAVEGGPGLFTPLGVFFLNLNDIFSNIERGLSLECGLTN